MYVWAYLLRRVDDVKISTTKLNGVLRKWIDHVQTTRTTRAPRLLGLTRLNGSSQIESGILPKWMAIYQNEWITFKLNGSFQLNSKLQNEWISVKFMAHYQIGMVHRKLNGILPKWITIYKTKWITFKLNGSFQLDGKLQNEWVTVKLNGSLPNWMAPAANGILDYGGKNSNVSLFQCKD